MTVSQIGSLKSWSCQGKEQHKKFSKISQAQVLGMKKVHCVTSTISEKKKRPELKHIIEKFPNSRERKKQITHRSLGIRMTSNFSAITLKTDSIRYRFFFLSPFVFNIVSEFTGRKSTSQQTINQKIKFTSTIKTFSDKQGLENEFLIHCILGSQQRTFQHIA